jgi:hypothetical protein
MAGINAQVVCTLGGGVVGRHLSGTAGGGIGVGLIRRCSAWYVGGLLVGYWLE